MKKYQIFLLLFMFVFIIPLFASGSYDGSNPDSSVPDHKREPFLFGSVMKRNENGEEYPLDGIKLIVIKTSVEYYYETLTDPAGNFEIIDYPGEDDFGEYQISIVIDEILFGTTEKFKITQNSTRIIIWVNDNNSIEIAVN